MIIKTSLHDFNVNSTTTSTRIRGIALAEGKEAAIINSKLTAKQP